MKKLIAAAAALAMLAGTTTAAEKEAWGRINDRDVARSLRKLWGKIPPSYRRLVASYYKDITDLVDDDRDAETAQGVVEVVVGHFQDACAEHGASPTAAGQRPVTIAS